MKVLILLAAIAATSAFAEPSLEVMVFGKSHHYSTHGIRFNEVNLGLGGEWKDPQGPWLVGGFALNDSLRHLGGAAYVGYRVSQPIGEYHIEATLRAGILKDAHYFGPAVLPAIGFGKGPWTVEATYIPKLGRNKYPTLGLWMRVAF